eukprot:118543_1
MSSKQDDDVDATVDATWIIVMLTCSCIGILLHIILIVRTVMEIYSTERKKRETVYLLGCVLLFVSHFTVCLICFLFITDLVNIPSDNCRSIYTIHLVVYFVAKYLFNLLMMRRIYKICSRTTHHIPWNLFITSILLVLLMFVTSIILWVYLSESHISTGHWMDSHKSHYVCMLTLTDDFMVKLPTCAIGLEDFVVAMITLFIWFRAFRKLSAGIKDKDLFQNMIRFLVLRSMSMISTLCLLTLAVIWYPNAMFLLVVDAIICSLCIFCTLVSGQRAYEHLCCPFNRCEVNYMNTTPMRSICDMVLQEELEIGDASTFSVHFPEFETGDGGICDTTITETPSLEPCRVSEPTPITKIARSETPVLQRYNSLNLKSRQ